MVQQYEQLPQPLSGMVYAHCPPRLLSSNFAVILHSLADLRGVEKAVGKAAKRGFRWLVTLFEKQRVTLVPEGSALAVIESPTTLQAQRKARIHKFRQFSKPTL